MRYQQFMRQFPDLSEIKAIIMDVDGVLTEGSIGYHADGNEIKFFNVRDGHGLVLARRAGLKLGILTGRKCLANDIRAMELKLDFQIQDCHNKKEGFLQILQEQNLKADECMYIGDDMVDMPPMRRAGFAVAVADAIPELDEVCHIRTQHCGGRGAVREAIEILLKGQGKWDAVTARYWQ